MVRYYIIYFCTFLFTIIIHHAFLFIFSRPPCPFIEWVEVDRLEKTEHSSAHYDSIVADEFLRSFYNWIHSKIMNYRPNTSRMLFEMSRPADSQFGAIHVDVIVFKGLPLPSYVSGLLQTLILKTN